MDTTRQRGTPQDAADGIQNGIQNDGRSMRAATDSRGNPIPLVYIRSGGFYARITDPATGRRTLRASPDGTLAAARTSAWRSCSATTAR